MVGRGRAGGMARAPGPQSAPTARRTVPAALLAVQFSQRQGQPLWGTSMPESTFASRSSHALPSSQMDAFMPLQVSHKFQGAGTTQQMIPLANSFLRAAQSLSARHADRGCPARRLHCGGQGHELARAGTWLELAPLAGMAGAAVRLDGRCAAAFTVVRNEQGAIGGWGLAF